MRCLPRKEISSELLHLLILHLHLRVLTSSSAMGSFHVRPASDGAGHAPTQHPEAGTVK
jgi:hypothetical protein